MNDSKKRQAVVRLIRSLGMLVVPTLIHVRWKYSRTSAGKLHERDVDFEKAEREWYDQLTAGSDRERFPLADRYAQHDRVVNNLLSIYQSDENRAHAVASKARGVLQSVGFVVAGNLAALTLSIHDRVSLFPLAIVLLLVSVFYLICTVVAYFLADHPRPWHVLDPEQAITAEQFGSRLLAAIQQNRDLSIYRTNYTVSAIRDVVRAGCRDASCHRGDSYYLSRA